MTPPSPKAYRKRAQIEAAIRRLPLLPDGAEKIDILVDMLCIVGAQIEGRGGDGTAPPGLRPANAMMVANELRELDARLLALARKVESGGRDAKAREKLAALIRGLHEPTIGALGAMAPNIMRGEPVLADVGAFRRTFPGRLESGAAISSVEIRFWAEVAKAAQAIEPETQNVGRPQDHRAQAVGKLLARQFQALTGREPKLAVHVEGALDGVPYGPYLDFVREIFAALGIARDGLSHAAHGSFALRGRGRRK